jgi:uncharacterized protein YkwD
MGAVRHGRIAALAYALALAACNLVTGADGIVIDSSDDGAGSDESDDPGPAAGGAGGGGATTTATGGAPTGTGGSSSGTGAGGASTSSSSSSSSSSTSSGTPTGSSSASSSSSSSSGEEACGGAGPATTPLDSEEQAFLGIINQYRQQNGLGALAHCRSLDRAAQGHSEDMRDQNYFDHIGIDGSTPWDRACEACFDLGCGPQTAMAENIAAGNSDAQSTFVQWQNSPGHNANMLGASFTMIGIGRAVGGGTYGTYWTNVFAGSDEPSCY